MENTNTNVDLINSVEKEKREPLELNIDPIPFNPVGEVMLTTTNDLAKVINDIFREVYNDYYGCSIVVQFNPTISQYVLSPVLYFRVLQKEAYRPDGRYGFKPLSVNAGDQLIGRVQRLSANIATVGPKVFMTDEMKDIMSNFTLDTKNFSWNDTFATNTMGDNTYVRVFKLDILKFLKFIYGDKDANGGELHYQPSVIRSIATQQYCMADNWSISVLRLNVVNEQFAAQQQGFMMTPMNAPSSVITAGTSK